MLDLKRIDKAVVGEQLRDTGLMTHEQIIGLISRHNDAADGIGNGVP